ncbi:TPA: hypothetical protein ACKPZR_003472 [Serratia marcescens]
MEVKDAVKTAISYVKDLYADENITNVGLEEVVQDGPGPAWVVTVGFSRPWDFPTQSFATTLQGRNPTRQYKAVKIDGNGKVVAVKIRETK